MSPQEKQKGPERSNNTCKNDSPESTVTGPVLTATQEMCYFCFDTLLEALQRNKPAQTFESPDITDVSVQCPLFVTWETHHPRSERQWQLRGCIGTLSPKLLVTSIGEYALLSALKDRRFRPIMIGELPTMRVAVSLLVNYQVCQHVYDWKIGVHGILIKFEVRGRHYNATYLPEVAKEQGWDHAQAVSSLIQKAGYQGTVAPELLHRIHCTRYESSKCRVTYDEYKMTKDSEDPLLLEMEQQLQSLTCTNM